MKIFLLDLWHDLRAKRLWPVAVALAVALVAVPVVLSKPSETAGPAPVQTVRKAPEPKEAAALAQVKLDSSADDARGSTLDTFDPSDPFKPPAKVTKKKTETDAPSSLEGNTGGTAAGDTGASTGTTDTGSTGGGYTGTTGGGYTGTTGGTGGGSTTTPTPQYRYVVDATFTANGRTRHIKGLERLDMLPNQASPLLMFLGATRDGGSAVFLVDSSLQADDDGEGKCKPKASECAFLYLGAGSEDAFTNLDGDSYTLRIDEIRKVRVDAGAGASRAKGAHAASGEPTAARRDATAPAPTITRVQSMRVSVGGMLTITGSHFETRRLENTVIFRGPNGRVAFAKPRRATTRKLAVQVPAAVSRLLQMSDGAQRPTRLKLRVLSARRFSEFTSRRLSPVVTSGSALPDAP
jgi:hypothetical protein